MNTEATPANPPRVEWVIRDYLEGRDLGTVWAVSERGARNAASRRGMWTRFMAVTPVEASPAPAPAHWEDALMEAAPAPGQCTMAYCERPAVASDPAAILAGLAPYRCDAHATRAHMLAAPRHADAAFDFKGYRLFIVATASGTLSRENALRAALYRDALPTPAEALTRRRASYAHRIHGTTWDALTA